MVKTPLTNHFPLEDSQDFLSVNFYPYDAEKIITTYKELKKKVTRIFPMEKKVNCFLIQMIMIRIFALHIFYIMLILKYVLVN